MTPSPPLRPAAAQTRKSTEEGLESRSLLAFLAPELVEAILEGTQPVGLTAEDLKRAGDLPLLWNEQRAQVSER